MKLSPPTSDFSQQCADLEEHGYCLIPNALDKDLLERVRERLVAQAEAERELSIAYSNPGHLDNQWVNMLLNKGEVFQQLVLHPVVNRLAAYYLGEDYLLSVCDAQIKNPGAGAMPIHTDQWWMPPPVAPRGRHERPADMKRNQGKATDPRPTEALIAPPAVLNVMWMITDFTTENGATRVMPGSHRSGLQPDPALPGAIETMPAQGKAGSAMVFDGRLWHAAGANTTGATRYGITCAFCGPQFRPLENYTLGLRPEVKESCPPELLRRLGFRAWSTYGHTGNPDLDCSVEGAAAVGSLP